jgi:hypothetical protein
MLPDVVLWMCCTWPWPWSRVRCSGSECCALGVGSYLSVSQACLSAAVAPDSAMHIVLLPERRQLLIAGLKPAMRTALGEAAGAHDQCSANAVGNAVVASRANGSDTGEQNPADIVDSSSAASLDRTSGTGATGSVADAATGSGYGSSGMFAGNSSNSGSTGAGGNGISASGGGGAPPSAMPWTYDYMLFILPRQYTGWSYTEVRRSPGN